MKASAPQRIRVERSVVTRVIRNLNGKGLIKVNIGQEVTPAEIIGSAAISTGFRTINLSMMLSVAPHEVEKYLARGLGHRIYKGELLAYKKGWFGQKVVTSPTDGVIDFLNSKTGELKISFMPKKIDLPAGVYGVVENVDQVKERVIIRTEVSRIYGVLGSGKLREGILRILGKRDDLTDQAMIRMEDEGQVLVGGSLFFKDAISAAISSGIGGLICGGINAENYRAMASGRLVFPRKLDNDIGITITACEGFGSIPIGEDIFSILQEYEGKFVFIDGNQALISLPSPLSSSLIKVRNTRLPEMPADDLLSRVERKAVEEELKAGVRVRIIGNSYAGEQGKIIGIDENMTLLPSGLRQYLALVECSRRKVQVPVANLEIIV